MRDDESADDKEYLNAHRSVRRNVLQHSWQYVPKRRFQHGAVEKMMKHHRHRRYAAQGIDE
jgi:hypothetical protein